MLPKMRCPIGDQKNPEILLDYVSRRLAAGPAAAVEAHAADCEVCQTFLAEQSAVWEAMDEIVAPEISANFDQHLYARIARENQEPWWKRAWRRLFEAGEPAKWGRPTTALSAACVALVAVVLIQPPTRKTEGLVSTPAVMEKTAAVRDTPDIELMERVLEDLEMLEALGPTKPIL